MEKRSKRNVAKMLVSILQKEIFPDNPIFPSFSFNSFNADLFTHLRITVHVQIDHLPPYHLILIVCEFVTVKYV